VKLRLGVAGAKPIGGRDLLVVVAFDIKLYENGT
jgi:hypothetical protein